MRLLESLTQCWNACQHELFPRLQDHYKEPLNEQHKLFVTVLGFIRIENFVHNWPGLTGRPASDRQALARAFAAKPIFKIKQTAALIERLKVDRTLMALCGWTSSKQIPSEATFSRAFAEFALSDLASRMHEALIKSAYEDQLVGHISRDSTAIEAREKPIKKPQTNEPQTNEPKRKRGRPKKGCERPPKPPRRLELQKDMTLPEMLADLPKPCDVGTKRNAKGYQQSWTGYKLHIDTADGGIPISCLLTSASLHDSQAAIPLATMTAERVDSCYDLMDAAYDCEEVKDHSRSLGHVPIVDVNPRANKALKEELAAEAKRLKLLGHRMPEDIRYNERSTAERTNARLKDEFGGRDIWVKGNAKVMCHLMFGILALTVDQMMRLVA